MPEKRGEMSAIGIYSLLLKKINLKIRSLEKNHRPYLTCHSGCSSCCKVPRTVLPIEAEYIKNHVKLDSLSYAKVLANAENSDNCPFLIDDLCSIYKYRPIICRTHGLPLLYYFEKSHKKAVTHCDLNFIEHGGSFREDDILDMETINSELIQINKLLKKGNERVFFGENDYLSQFKLTGTDE